MKTSALNMLLTSEEGERSRTVEGQRQVWQWRRRRVLVLVRGVGTPTHCLSVFDAWLTGSLR